MAVATSSPSFADSRDARPTGISLRAALLSLGLALGFGYLIPIVDMKMRNTFLGATHFPPGALAALLTLLLVVNPLLRRAQTLLGRALVAMGTALLAGAALALRWRGLSNDNLAFAFWVLCALAATGAVVLLLGRRPLCARENAVVYISCLFSCLTPGHGAENVFVVNLIGPFYYATEANKWLEFLQPSLRPWMTPALHASRGAYDSGAKDVVSGWFLGVPSGQIPWSAWLVPLLVWGGFIFLLYAMMACLCVMLRQQWVEREALAFPLLRLPLEMTDEGGAAPQIAFFRNPLVWLGFGLAVGVQLLRGLHVYFVDVPDFPLALDTASLLTEAPWNQIGVVPVKIWPIVVGVSYLLTSEISFSFWFFFWFIKAELLGAYFVGFMPATLPNALGALGGGYKTFTSYQQIGCYLAYVAVMVFTGREHLKHIAARAFGLCRARAEERDEALSYPLAFWGFTLSFGLIVAWSVAAGLNPQLALALWGLYLVIIIALTRIICEAGILFVQQGWVPLGALGQIANAGPGHWLLPQSALPPAALLQGSLMTDLRGLVMPSFMQGFKLAHERRIALKPLLALMLACSILSLGLGVYMNTRLGYAQGGLTLDPWYAGAASTQPASVSANLIRGVKDASWFNLLWVGAGIALTYALMLARSRFAWFPLHPIGFLISQSYPISEIWFSIFLGWWAKVLVARFGGAAAYRKLTPLFLGLILGDVAMMLFWLIIDGWQGRIGHKLMPG